MTDTSPARPKNVVVVDADNPLVEIRGEFFWREDHERLLTDARDQAFQRGYAEGYAAAHQQIPSRIVLRRRSRGWLVARLVLAMLTFALFGSLILTAFEFLTRR